MAFDVKKTNIEITATDKTKIAFDSVKSSIGNLTSQFGALTGLLGAGAFAAMTKRIIDQADSMNDLSKRTGISVEQIGAWRLATEQSGTSMEALTQALSKGSKYMVQHGDDLKKIGVTAKTSEELILQLSGVISKMDSDDPRRMALAMQVFGKSAGELIPLMSEGEAGLRKMLDRGRELNPMTQQLANEADQFNDTLAEMKLQASGLAVSITKDLLPGLNAFFATLQKGAENGEIFSGFFGGIWDGMKATRGRVAARDRLKEIPDRMKYLSGGLPNGTVGDRARIGFELRALANEENNLKRQLGMIKDEKKSFTTDAKFDEASLNAFLSTGNDKSTKRDTVGDRIREMERENVLLAQGKTMEEARMVARLQADGASKAQIETMLRLNTVQTEWEAKQKASEKAQDDLKKATEDHNEAMKKMLETADEAVISAQREYEESARGLQVLQLGESAVIRMEAARLQEAAASAEQGLAYARLNGLSQENIDFTETQILRLKQLADVRLKQAGGVDAREAFEKEKDRIQELEKEQEKAADELLKYQKDNARELSQALTNGLFDSFKKGESFGKSMIRNLAALAQTWLSRMIEGLFTGGGGIISTLGGLLGGTVSTNAIASGNVLTGTGSNSIFGQLSSIKDLLGGGNNFITGSIEKLGAWIANGQGGIADSIGGALGQYSGAISDALGYAGAAFQLAKGNVAGAALTAVGTYFGGPIGGAIGGAIGSLFGGKKLPPRVTASRSGTFMNGAFTASEGLDPGKRSLGANGALDSINEQFSRNLNALLSGFGVSQTIGTRSVLTKKKNTTAVFGVSLDGVEVGLFKEKFGKKGDFSKMVEAIADNAFGPMMVKAIQASKLSDGIKKFFDGLADKTVVSNTINSLVSMNAQLKDLPPIFNQIRDAINTTAYKTSITDLQALFSNTQTYTNLFYTQQEQFDTFTKQLNSQFAELNATLPATRDGFRALVDGLMNDFSESGRKQFAGLVALSGAADAYYKQLQQQKEALEALRFQDVHFTTRADQSAYLGIKRNYDAQLAYDYVSNLGAGNIRNTSSGSTSVGGQITAEVVQLLRDLRDFTKQNLSATEGSMGSLQRIETFGVKTNA